VPTIKKRPVVVTTEHKGVFFGFLEKEGADKTAVLTEGQMCVFWSSDVHGVLGLAATGPSVSCRISPPVPKITLQAVTAVIDCADEAVTRWQQRPWS
jgi:hypothetical protein